MRIRLATYAICDLRHSARLKNVPREGCEPRVLARLSKAGATNNNLTGGCNDHASFPAPIGCGRRSIFPLKASGPRGRRTLPASPTREIKFGQTIPLSGPASAYSVVGRAEASYFRMINEQGGVNGRKLNFLDVDDAYSPPKTIEQTRRLVEHEGVAFVFNGVGTAAQLAVRPYLNENKVPQLFSAFGIVDSEHYPWTLPFFQIYATEAAIYAKYTLQTQPQAKVAILYQNDDLGRSYLKGFVDGLGPEHQGMIVKTAFLRSVRARRSRRDQVISLQASGADVLLIAASPKFAAQAIRKAADLHWKPTRYLSVVSSTIAGVLKPAGLDNSRDLVTALWGKDFTRSAMGGRSGREGFRGFH